MNIIESIFRTTGQQDAPTHIGEAFHLWTYFVEVCESRAIMLVLLNHSSDRELKEMLEHFVADVLEPQIQRLEELLRNEGIILPPITPNVPKADHHQIPAGAKHPDSQIANMLVVKVLGLIEYSNRGLSVSLRDDIGLLFSTFHTHILAQGFTLKKLMKQKGWLIEPPFFYESRGADPS